MKKRIQKWGLAVALILFCLPVFAEEYRAECMTPKKKYKKCTVFLQGNTLEWKFNSEKYQEFNGKIEGDQIGLVLSGQVKKEGIPYGGWRCLWGSKRRRQENGGISGGVYAG